MENITQIKYSIVTLINLEINIVHFIKTIFIPAKYANKILMPTTPIA